MSSGNPVGLNTRKERFSLAYIQAVAARAGYDVVETSIDVDSIDGLLRSTVGRRPQIEFQAKATSREVLGEERLSFPLKLKNYDELRAETINPRVLIVVLLPDDESDWMVQSESELAMRRCGYWLSLRGWPPTDASTQVTVHLPRSQVFDVGHLTALMAKADMGPEL